MQLTSEVKPYLTDFDQIMALRGEVFRELENRRTQKINLNGKNYFIKQHFGIGWKEIFKNILQLRLPVTSAKNEWQAIQKLQSLHIPTQTLVGYGKRGANPATTQSFLLTQELPEHISLEHLCQTWRKQRPAFRLKLNIIREIAHIARTLHQAGINHRDFYLCHFLLDKSSQNTENSCKLFLIDLHRAQIRQQAPTRWVIKDLAGLYFSSKDTGLMFRDILRFMKAYRNKPLRELLNKEAIFWRKVEQRGNELYRKHGNP